MKLETFGGKIRDFVNTAPVAARVLSDVAVGINNDKSKLRANMKAICREAAEP